MMCFGFLHHWDTSGEQSGLQSKLIVAITTHCRINGLLNADCTCRAGSQHSNLLMTAGQMWFCHQRLITAGQNETVQNEMKFTFFFLKTMWRYFPLTSRPCQHINFFTVLSSDPCHMFPTHQSPTYVTHLLCLFSFAFFFPQVTFFETCISLSTFFTISWLTSLKSLLFFLFLVLFQAS